MFIGIKLVEGADESFIPKKAHQEDSGFDLKSFECKFIAPGSWVLLSTGFYIDLPFGHEAIIRPRSGLALKHGITVLNSPATIDENYKGIVGVILINHSNDGFIVNIGDRIAQMVIQKKEDIELITVSDIGNSKRGNKGFGSTGK